jgi:hypothetical protein
MRRRKFIALVAGATALPLAARAQQADRVRRIGVLIGYAEDDPETNARLVAFRQRLEKRGWTEGRNVHIETRFAGSDSTKYEPLAKELVATQPDVILAHTTRVAAALQRESRVIPIVFVNVSDPIGSGFIASLARPGGNFTGVMQYEASVVSKWLAMLKEIEPRLERVAFVANPKTTPYDYFLRAAEAAALALSIKMVSSPVATAANIEQQSGHSRVRRTEAYSCRRMALPSCIAISSSRLRSGTNCLRSTRFIFLSRPAASCRMGPTKTTISGWRRPMSTVSCAATNPPISQYRPPPSSEQPSTLERRRRSTSPFRRGCWSPPTR